MPETFLLDVTGQGNLFCSGLFIFNMCSMATCALCGRNCRDEPSEQMGLMDLIGQMFTPMHL